jgi:hypothetical protein
MCVCVCVWGGTRILHFNKFLHCRVRIRGQIEGVGAGLNVFKPIKFECLAPPCKNFFSISGISYLFQKPC